MRRRVQVGVLGVAVLVAVGAGILALGPLGVNALSGERSAGYFAWSSPIVAARSSRTVSVEADVEGRDDDIGCNSEVLPHVRETGAVVTIRVEIVNRPLPVGTACGSPALSRLPVAVQLRQPLGDRAVVDGRDGVQHTVLALDQVPTIRDVPRPFERRATSWDEAAGRVGQWWRWQTRGEAAQIDLDFGPARPLSQLGLPARATGHASIGDVSARIWRQQEGDSVSTTVLWTPSRGETFLLQVVDQSTHPLSQSAILELARSIRSPRAHPPARLRSTDLDQRTVGHWRRSGSGCAAERDPQHQSAGEDQHCCRRQNSSA